jgi:hypothetical protein
MESAEKLVRLLAYFPLAISQAGVYISIHQQNITAYHDLFLKSPRYDFGNNVQEKAAKYFCKSNIVLTVWEISFAAIQDRDSEAARILLICGFLDRSDIWEEMFLDWIDSTHKGTLPCVQRACKHLQFYLIYL